ncbi:MAG: histidine phosphatase family protein [Oscillospiraceae bacterium]
MTIYLLRHGATEYNKTKQFTGTRDLPISEDGKAALCKADFEPETVYVSTLCRTHQTAKVLFPTAKLIQIADLREKCFGIAEGKYYTEISGDECESGDGDDGRFEGGESSKEFIARTCKAFAKLVDEAFADGRESLVIVAHGGTQMSVLSTFAQPRQDYYTWCAKNGGGYILQANAETWKNEHVITVQSEVAYNK